MDKVNNNFNNYHSSSINNKDEVQDKVLDKNERLNILIGSCNEHLLEKAEREVPENGKFSTVSLRFKIPESNNQGLFSIKHDEENPKDIRRLFIGVHHQNSDRIVSNLLTKGTKAEIISYLKNKNNIKNIQGIINHLSTKTDEYYSSL